MNNTNGKSTGGIWKRMVRIVSPDWVFALYALLVGIMVYESSMASGKNGEGPDYLVMLGLIGIIGLLAAIASRFDRKMIEEFHYRLMAQGAIVSVIATMIVVAIYEKVAGMGALTGKDVIIILSGCWIIGYFYHRWRGLDV
jgi:hypothetical protein